MRKNDLKFLQSLIEGVNPLKLSNEDGTSKIFHTYSEAYLYLLEKMDEWAVDTYFDTEFILSKLYKRKYPEIHSLYMSYCKPLGIKQHHVVRPDKREVKAFYRDFMKALHSYCETMFDTSQFDLAFNLYTEKKERITLIKSTKELEEERKAKLSNEN